jgi:hypothetical protein
MSNEEQIREKARYLRKVLAEEYGIHNDKELEEAIRKTKPLNIGIFVSPVPSRENKEVV